tara:strand:+ start:67 stop:444 length:378 start_codon:yes stop_codon:yes gene_type:complete
MIQTIQSETSAAPVGPYSPALKVDNFLFISGQIPLKSNGELVENDFEAEVHQVLQNLGELLKAAGLDYNHLVKVGIFTTDLSKFDLINTIYSQYVKEPYPARAAVEVPKLPKGARIEMEAIAHVT